ncbi:MAG: protoporphyrinogen oxidase [Proteobacteria bacterium]|nr:MAG: protoporphyrinogen oxidase [Pseudomonadota bacterium]
MRTRWWGRSFVKRILIVFATREGQTEKVSRRLADALEAAGVSVRLVDARDRQTAGELEPDTYDLLVCGASMHVGGLERELIDFVRDHTAAIARTPRSFFLVLLSAAARDPSLRDRWLADARRKMDAQLAVSFDDVEMIAGALAYSRYSAPVKWLMRRIARQAGEGTDPSRDYEYTDWAQVERYARRLAEQ